MLQGKYGGRNQNRHLLAVRDGLESGSHGYFGLSETHVPADQPVHGAVVLHVSLDGYGRALLIGSVFIHERRFKLLLQERIGRKSIAFRSLALGIKLYQFLRYVLYL